jgi:hypothetical protein
MSITITARPRTSQQAAYNPIVYEFDSTQKNQPGFRYIVELFNLFTGQKITEFRIAPAPVHGRGYVDVSKILSNFVDKSLQFQSVYNATNSTMINYSARFGEEFQLNWVFNDYIFSAGSIALTTDSAFGAGFSNATHSFSVGDQIFIQMNTTYNDNRDNLNGYFTVTEILSNKTIVINLPFSVVGSGPASPGKITYADGRKTRLLNLANTGKTPQQAFNMALDLDELKQTLDSNNWNWLLNSPSKELLTDLPDEYPMHLTQFGYAHAYDNDNNNAFWMYVENSEGEVFRKIISTGGTSLVRGFSYGPGNIGTLIPVTGVLPLIKPVTKWYKFWTANGADVRTSKEYTINVDRRCLIEPIQILFMDRKGSWSTFMFDLRQKRRLTTEKKSYRKEFGRIQTGSPTNWATFDKTDQGLINYTSRGQLKYELNTNWLDDSENIYFEQLLTSPYTYVNFGDGAWKACIVEDGQFETELQRNRRLIRRTISITPAIEDPINI